MDTLIAEGSSPSVSDLRSLVATHAPEFSSSVDGPINPKTAEPPAEKPAEHKEAEPAPAHIQEPNEPVEDEPLPEAVQKRIAKEAEKQARYQAEINKAVSARKAKEDELAKLTGDTGTDPAKSSAPATSKPVKPDFAAYTEEGKSYSDFKADLDKYETAYESWLISEADKRADAKWTEKQRESEAKREWEAAEKEFPGFNAARELVAANSSEPLQMAISQLDGWKSVVAHLGKPENADELKTLVAQAEKAPYAAAASLGRLEDRLKTPIPNGKPVAVLPKPPNKDGGRASADTAAVDLNKVGMDRFKSEVRRRLGPTG